MHFGRWSCCWSLAFSLVSGFVFAQDWDPEDATFDPGVKSVVIGNRSWLGDPCPFTYTSLPRTGYTHVAATQFEGYPPSVQISLIVPLEPGETKSVGGMLMMNEEQTRGLLNKLEAAIKHIESSKEKESSEQHQAVVDTAMDHVQWTVVTRVAAGKPCIQFESKTDEKVEAFRFSVNATRKLIGAVQHALSQLKKESDDLSFQPLLSVQRRAESI